MVTMRMFILFFVLFVSFGGNGFFQWWLWSEKLEPTEVKEVELEEETSTTWALLIARSKGFHNYRHQATKLQKLIVKHCPDVMLPRLLHSQSLCGVVIYNCKPEENLERVERMSLTRMLSNMPIIRVFSIDGHSMKSFIAENIPKWLPHAVNCLTSLWLQNIELGDLNQLECVLCLLQSSPNLKTLSMTHVQMEPQDMNYDVGASSHLEAPNCLDQTLNQLQIVKIGFLQRLKPEQLFIKLLLAHSPSLEKLRVEPSKTFDAIKRLDMAMDVMRFPRASTKAEVIFVNSNP